MRAKWCQEIGQKRIEEGQLSIELANLCEKWGAGENNGLYIALSTLTESEFNQTYASLKRDANRQMQHALPEDNQDGSDCNDRDSGNSSQSASMTKYGERAADYTHDSLCSCDRFFDLSARVDQINVKLDKSLLFYDKADISKWTDHTTAKSPKSF